MVLKTKQEAQQPLILRAHRLMEAFAKSDDERDFYLDRVEGFLVYVDLDRPIEDIEKLEQEIKKNPDRYCMIPKLTFYDTKKIMEGFVNEKIYDIDTKEKLLEIISSKEARSNFLEFVHDHHHELEKWQQYYQERSRIRIIEWLRTQHFNFVFEEDLEFPRQILEELKQNIFTEKVDKDVLNARKALVAKAKGYYSLEALNPRPKRGRPPKQIVKQEIEPQISSDIYLTVSSAIRPFLFIPEMSHSSSVTFAADFASAAVKPSSEIYTDNDTSIATLQKKLTSLRKLSTKWVEEEEEEDDEEFDDFDKEEKNVKALPKKKIPVKKAPSPKKKTEVSAPKIKEEKETKDKNGKRRLLRPLIRRGNVSQSTPVKQEKTSEKKQNRNDNVKLILRG